jgi:hypothetical protein
MHHGENPKEFQLYGSKIGKRSMRYLEGERQFYVRFESDGVWGSDEESALLPDEEVIVEMNIRALFSESNEEWFNAMEALIPIVESRPSTASYFAHDLIVLRLVELGKTKVEDGRQLVLKLAKALFVCSPEVSDMLLDVSYLRLLLKTLTSIRFTNSIKRTALASLHRIACKSSGCCRKMFEDCQISKSKLPKVANAVQCVMHIIDEQKSTKIEQCDLGFDTDEAAIGLRISCVRFLAALLNCKYLPTGCQIQEIIDHLILSTYLRNPEIRLLSVYGCVAASSFFYIYFQSTFRQVAGIAHFQSLLKEAEPEVRGPIIQVFINIASKSKEEATFLWDTVGIGKEPVLNLSESVQILWCELVSVFIESLGRAVIVSEMVDGLSALVRDGPYSAKLAAVGTLNDVLATLNQGECCELVSERPELLRGIAGLLIASEETRVLKIVINVVSVMVDATLMAGIDLQEGFGDEEIVLRLEELCVSRDMDLMITAKMLRSQILGFDSDD